MTKRVKIKSSWLPYVSVLWYLWYKNADHGSVQSSAFVIVDGFPDHALKPLIKDKAISLVDTAELHRGLYDHKNPRHPDHIHHKPYHTILLSDGLLESFMYAQVVLHNKRRDKKIEYSKSSLEEEFRRFIVTEGLQHFWPAWGPVDPGRLLQSRRILTRYQVDFLECLSERIERAKQYDQ